MLARNADRACHSSMLMRALQQQLSIHELPV
jgi:hypothetical protein